MAQYPPWWSFGGLLGSSYGLGKVGAVSWGMGSNNRLDWPCFKSHAESNFLSCPQVSGPISCWIPLCFVVMFRLHRGLFDFVDCIGCRKTHVWFSQIQAAAVVPSSNDLWRQRSSLEQSLFLLHSMPLATAAKAAKAVATAAKVRKIPPLLSIIACRTAICSDVCELFAQLPGFIFIFFFATIS